MNEFEHFAKVSIDVSMIFAPNIGFIAQIMKFRELKSSEGFSKLISLIVFLANILRIFFWIGKRFSLVLLFQSICAIVMQIILLRECLLLSAKGSGLNSNTKEVSFHYKPISLFNLRSFWDWPFLIDYIYVLVIFTFILAFTSHMIGFENAMYTEGLGVVAATVEACIGLPQIFSNCKNKNTDTLSFFMLFSWALGDAFKTFYFLKTKAPLQMLVCALIQFSFDVLLVGQLLYYTYLCPLPKATPTKKDYDIDLYEDEEEAAPIV
jgi:uncharacterized protein with PQ loop repeat